MALGGGTWLFQNKVLPGAYINFKSKYRPNTEMVDRGFGAMAMELDWGPVNEVFAVEAEDFQEKSVALFGYDYTSEKLKGLRDLFKNLKTGYFYRLANGAEKATCDLAKAKYAGVRGNDITVAVEANPDEEGSFIVYTYLDVDGVKTLMDQQAVTAKAELVNNDLVDFIINDTELTASAGMKLSGGSNGESITATQHQSFLSAIESYYFNAIGVVTTDPTLKSLYIAFTKRMRDDVGMKFQLVVYDAVKPDYEGVINIKNKVTDSGASPASLVWWVVGAEASCAVNASCTNKVYDGEYAIEATYSQTELKKAITSGYLTFHRVTDPASGDINGDIKVLTDINSFVSFSKAKNKEFAKNQVVRVLDQIAIDIARLFNRFYLGKEPNDADGRSALWNDIVAYYKELQRVRAIQNFVETDVPMPQQGDEKDAVLSEHAVQPTCAMEKLYMTVNVA